MNNLSRNDISQTIQTVAQRVFGDPTLQITDSLGPDQLAAWTSLTYTQLLTEIETTFNIKFKILEIIKMQTMGAIIDITMQHLAAND
ncbi:MAG: hypothetical protein IJ785_08975 [Bacteroidales bacterium]|nr:hypothetical protein [Bacteroidales bacterium]